MGNPLIAECWSEREWHSLKLNQQAAICYHVIGNNCWINTRTELCCGGISRKNIDAGSSSRHQLMARDRNSELV
jgi:hypothetical protein